ncbi:TonB-dependent receptor [Capnocytophaga canimorsus]|uniref:TonB-dependent receptor n=1 Tax=Capnocytophaga canimorsus TaxID=28188 RepID=UPI001EDE9323|nr:TonB-dependent receptor [Capnocytophaga canimorsus]GJQ03825.1 TonB-dependent receptor [Capnocytophaga canimorsus]
MKFNLFFMLCLLPIFLWGQNISGNVSDEKNNPLMGVNIFWEGTSKGVTTDTDGNFTIASVSDSNTLIFSYIGFKTQKVIVKPSEKLQIRLLPETDLDEVVVSHKKQTTVRSKYQVANLQVMSHQELLKAACCNLSESFSTNPSIDVHFSDAVTGNKQIKMLGLTSPYILMAEENVPAIRGASQAYGLSFIPGTWIESIQITKGAGSVTNGYESISGQINYEILKPATNTPIFFNAYAANDGRFELNNHLNHHFSDKCSATLFIHGNLRKQKSDHNSDGFLDHPIGNQINILNRWQFLDAEKGWVSFLNLHYMKDEKQGGMTSFSPKMHRNTTKAWGSEINTEKISALSKIGYVFPEISHRSFGFQNAFQSYNQNSYFGLNQYNVKHNSFFSNLMYNSIIENVKHKFSTGLNFIYDHFDESVTVNFSKDFTRTDYSFGAFFEYTYDNLDNFSLVGGLRADSHNQMGTFLTPRLHLRYNPWEGSTLRASAGRGKRMANFFTENQQFFASNRHVLFTENSEKLYQKPSETAWNYGVSLVQSFYIFSNKAELAIDFYRTEFQEQIVVDMDNSPQQLWFYKLNGKSFSNSLQAELSTTPLKGVDLRMAYKWNETKTSYLSGTYQKALTPEHRFFTNLAYQSPTKKDGYWKFDLTYNWLSKQRFPSTLSNPKAYQMGNYAPDFSTFNAQITKVFSNHFEIYFGGENLGGYKQHHSILAADAPFGNYFDSTLIYAPTFGRMFYTGLRYSIGHPKK